MRFSLQAVVARPDNMKLVQSLRGPRGGMIFFKKEPVLGVDLESAINNAVFPGLQVYWNCLLAQCDVLDWLLVCCICSLDASRFSSHCVALQH